jgi:hypothetical protein
LYFVDPEYEFVIPSTLQGFSAHPKCPHIPGDVYLFIDVLEHVTHDVALLAHYVQEANIGARFVLTVPAFMAFWSGHDVFLEHKKRYTKCELEKVATDAGLKVSRSYYLFSFLTPLIYLIRKVKSRKSSIASDMKEFNPLVNALLKSLCTFEHKFFANKFFGLSVIVFAEKIN